MKIIISGYFDAGYSIGIDDFHFSDNDTIARLSSETGYAISYSKSNEAFSYNDEEIIETPNNINDSEENIGINVSIGSGLLIDFTNTALVEKLHAEALECASDKVFMGEYYNPYPRGIVKIIKDFQNLVNFKKATVNLYGLGVGYVYFESGELPKEMEEFALWIYRCYEYATYGTYSSKFYRNSFKQDVLKIYSGFAKNDNIGFITRRKIPRDFFPGYQIILLCTGEGDAKAAQVILKDYDELNCIPMDDGTVMLGWAAAIVNPSNINCVARIMYLLKISQVYYGICDGFERLFTYHISASVRESLEEQGHDYDAASLNRLRTIAHTVTEFTRFSTQTQNVSDLKLLNAFDKLGGLSLKIDHLASACEIFTNIQNEVLDQKQAKRDKRLNIYAMALTALTIVSVMADMISIREAMEQKGYAILLKIGAILCLIMLIIYMLFEGRSKKKSIKKHKML